MKWSYVFTHSAGTISVLPEWTASSAFSAIPFILRNHCVEIIGSTTPPERWQRGSVSVCGLAPRARPLSASAFFTARAGLLAVHAREGAGVRVERPVEVEDVDLLELVALARREVVEVVRGRHLHGAGAELRVDEHRVGHDGEGAVDERVLDALAVERGVARVVRVHGDGRVAEHRLRARRRDDDLASALDLVRELEELPVRALLVLDLEVAEATSCTRGTS